MIDNKKVLAVIPARGGSKRLPRKNILPLGGKPLVGWTIGAAKQCEYIDRIIVSTEDVEIARISKQFGGEVPFYRPHELSQDKTTTLDVVLHLLDKLEQKGETYDYVILLQPTSPLRTAQHITDACEQIVDNNDACAIVSTCLAEHHPLWCNTLPENGSMSNFIQKEIHNLRSQDLPDYYRLNGAIYICETEVLRSEKTFFPSHGCYTFIMSQEDSVDIDTKDDFDRAQLYVDDLIVDRSDLLIQLYVEYKNKHNRELDCRQFKQYLSNLINEEKHT